MKTIDKGYAANVAPFNKILTQAQIRSENPHEINASTGSEGYTMWDTKDDPPIEAYEISHSEFLEEIKAPQLGYDSSSASGYGAWEINGQFSSPRYIVKGILDEGETASIFGASQTLKSFLALDMLLHVAIGKQWRKFKVRQVGVLIILGEGSGSYQKRIYAWLNENQLVGANKDKAPWLWVNPIPVDLHNHPEAIEGLILAASQAIGHPVKLVLIDTLSTNLGDGADENSTGHMATIIAKTKQSVMRATGGAGSLVFVHHSGHGASDRERGSSTLAGNLDNRILVTRDGESGLGENITIQCRKRKDGELFEPFCLSYKSVVICRDNDGEHVTSLVITDTEALPVLSLGRSGGKKPSNRDKFQAALSTARQISGRSVEKDTVRTEFYILHGGKEGAKRKAFDREWLAWSDLAISAANQAAIDRLR